MNPLEVLAGPDPEWFGSAACAGVDPELFYPPKGHRGTDARAVCGRCPVRHECLEYALEHDEYQGIWGGMSPPERSRLGRWRHAAHGTGLVCRQCGFVSVNRAGLATHEAKAHPRSAAS